MKIIFDCERMKYPHTGLYHFCHHLGNALKEEAVQYNHNISFFVRESERLSFGKDAEIIKQNSLHKFWMPSLHSYQIWQATYQGTHYFPYRSKIKKVLTIHDLNFLYEHASDESKKKKELKRLQDKIDRSDAVVAISNFVMNDILNHLNVQESKVRVIYNGCNIQQILNTDKPDLSPSQPFLYTIGTINEKKNFHVLPALLKSFDGVLVISGVTQDPVYREKIIQESKRHQVEDRVIFTGPVAESEKQWYLRHCEAFVFPSLAEGFGLPVIEAMYFGKPTLLSTRTSLPEIGGDESYYFDDFDPEHMQQIMLKCLESKNQPEKIEKIKRRSSAFSWKSAAIHYHELYEEIIKQ